MVDLIKHIGNRGKLVNTENGYEPYIEQVITVDALREWLSSFDTSSATKCFEAVNLLKQRLEGEE